MEMKQISETTLKITISMEDLDEYGMELKDFLIPQEKTEEFFYTVMDELDLPDNFKDSGMLSFRVTPRKDRVDVFVTKSELKQDLSLEDLANLEDVSDMSPEDFFKTLEQSMMTKGDTEAHKKLEQIEDMIEAAANATADAVEEEAEEESQVDYVHYVFAFSNMEEVVTFAHGLDQTFEASELYKEGASYYMTVLVDIQEQPSYYSNLLYARLLEHAEPSMRTRAYLREHGVTLLEEDALGQLQEIEMV